MARYDAGQPSLRVIREKTGLSLSALGDIFKGKSRPQKNTLVKVVAALCENGGSRILDLYDMDSDVVDVNQVELVPNAYQRRTDAINNLAAAVNRLADAMTKDDR